MLVEAKAHGSELSAAGKRIRPSASSKTHQNHGRICKAIAEASAALNKIGCGVNLSSGTHYQLANRVAFAWKLASMGVPVILVYLAFLGDTSVGEPIRDQDHWQEIFMDHTKSIIPPDFVEHEVDCGSAAFRILLRSRPALLLATKDGR